MSEGRGGGSGSGRSPGNLTLRVISGLVLGVLALALTYWGGMAFRLFTAVLAVLVFHEWMAMRPSQGRAHAIVAWVAFAAALIAMLAGISAPAVFVAIGAALLLALFHSVFSGNGTWSAAGIAYAGLPTAALAQLRGDDTPGLIAILFLFGTVWATDVFAYFVGRTFGGPKLAPAISSGKTWSGAVGGAAGAILAGTAVVLLSGSSMPFGWAVVLALLLSVVSQAGDLFESALKRRSGVKDSGTLIPGHGGVMDRVDGLVAAALVLYWLGIVFSGYAAPAEWFLPMRV